VLSLDDLGSTFLSSEADADSVRFLFGAYLSPALPSGFFPSSTTGTSASRSNSEDGACFLAVVEPAFLEVPGAFALGYWYQTHHQKPAEEESAFSTDCVEHQLV